MKVIQGKSIFCKIQIEVRKKKNMYSIKVKFWVYKIWEYDKKKQCDHRK